MMRKLLAVGALLVAGCGSGSQQFSVNGLTLNAQDQLYVSRPAGTFCDFAPTGQITLRFFDYPTACILDREVNAPDPRDPALEHTELDIIVGGFYTGGPHENLRNPFTVSRFDCKVGPGDEGTAFFYHFPANSMAPDTTLQVDSGTVKLDQFDKTNAMPAKGSFDLKFGGSSVKGNIDALDCDVPM
jgi:hypothetical protein